MTVVYIDSLALLYRAYHAIPNLTARSGMPTGALFGFVNSLLRVIDELRPDHVVACFDRPEETLRQEAYAGYKASREIPEDDLIAQIEAAKELLLPLGAHVIERAGHEADDLLGTLAVRGAKDGDDAVIVTCDGDLLQLTVVDRIRVYFLRKGMGDVAILDADGVAERNGYPAARIVDYKGLAGDSSDAIPGVSGIGDTFAKRLLAAFGDLDGIYRALDSGEIGDAGFTKRVETLLTEGRDDAFLSRDLATIRTDVPALSFPKEKTWRKRVSVPGTKRLFERYDFTDLVRRFLNVVGEESGEEDDGGAEDVSDSDPDARRACIALWVLDASQTDASAKDALAYTGEKTVSRAYRHILRKLKEKNALSVWETIEEPLLPVVDRMEGIGIRFDPSGAAVLRKEYDKKIARLEKEIYRHAGKEFNISSPKQLSAILYTDLGLRPKRAATTSSGWKTTKESALRQLVDAHPIIPAVLAHRHYGKLRSTYASALPAFVGSDGRIHTRLVQNGTETGRFSSRDPNLQNIPKSGEEGTALRNLFLATEGWTMVAVDYVQFDLRIAAILSKDRLLLRLFSADGDVHAFVASQIFSVPEESVTGEQRQRAKTINYSILYGTGVRSLQHALGVTHADAARFMKRYKEAFPTLFTYLDSLRGEAVKNGEVQTAFGRIRPVPEITSGIAYVRARAERIAMNSVIQGTAADVMKIAMIGIDDMLEKRSFRDSARMLLQIHDELLLEIRPDVLDEVVSGVTAIMESVYPPDKKPISLPVTVRKGDSWGSLA